MLKVNLSRIVLDKGLGVYVCCIYNEIHISIEYTLFHFSEATTTYWYRPKSPDKFQFWKPIQESYDSQVSVDNISKIVIYNIKNFWQIQHMKFSY